MLLPPRVIAGLTTGAGMSCTGELGVTPKRWTTGKQCLLGPTNKAREERRRASQRSAAAAGRHGRARLASHRATHLHEKGTTGYLFCCEDYSFFFAV